LDINDKIAKNRGLIYKQLRSFQLTYDQDAESMAYEALHKAILTYNEEAGTAFSTYATCVINNALRHHLRTLNKKRQLDVVSYYTPLFPDDESSACIVDVLVHPDDAESALIDKESRATINKAFSEEYKLLSAKHQKVVDLFYVAGSMTQQEIAKSVGITQATVSKVISAFRHRLKVRLEELMNE
jgi:RNA polymerase sigma factor (sigma-70 family)